LPRPGLGDGGADKLLGQGFELLAPLNGLRQPVGLVWRHPAGLVLALFPDLVLEIGTRHEVGILPGRTAFLLERTSLHRLNLFHLLKKLSPFVRESIHPAIMTSR
jgi:hypothetical protein